MKVSEEEVKQVVREETGRWLASIWREPEPSVRFTAGEGLDPFVYTPSTQEGQMVVSLKSCHDVTIYPHGSAEVSTGISMEVPKRTCAIVLPDRELDLNSCVAANAILGEGESGTISLRVYNFGEYPYEVRAGQKVASMVIVPAMAPNYVIGEK